MFDDSGYERPLRRRGRGNFFTHTLMGILGAALAAGLILALYTPSGPGISLPGSGAVPAPAASAPRLSSGEQGIATKVEPGVVIVNTTLQYSSEAAAG